MRFTRLSLIGLLALPVATWANEHGAPPPAEGGEAGGEGKAAKAPRDQREFTEKSTKANALAGKVEEAEKRFKELVHEKEEARSAAARAPILKEMVEVSKQREKDERELTRLRTELQQRYPNQGTHVNRQGARGAGEDHEPAEARASTSLDDLIRETKTKIDHTYGVRGDSPKVDARAPASEKAVLRPRLRLER